MATTGDGTFEVFRRINRTFNDAIAVDLDKDGFTDIVLNGSGYAAMALFNRTSIGPNLPPIADGGPDLTFSYPAQFDGAGISLTALRSYDPNLDPLTYQWLDAAGAVLGAAAALPISGKLPGAYTFTLVVRDVNGSEARDVVTVTVTAYEEIVKCAADADYRGTWIKQADGTAAASIAARDPNLNAPKAAAPLQFPSSYVDFIFRADPTQEYKLWIRLKAERNSFSNDSIFVQFDGAVDPSGRPIDQIETTEALAVNLEECSGCGLSGWGWRDDAWGTRGAISAVTLRFPETGPAVRRIRIQTREDGVMVDQVVLSSRTYKTTRPGAVKNDAVILGPTKF